MTRDAQLVSRGSFEALAESAPDAIFTIDEHSTILFANAASERVFGYAPHELIGRRLTEVIPERLRAAHEVGIARYLETGRHNIPWTGVELPGLRKDGSEIPLEISFGEFVDEEGHRVFSGFMRDVSERVRYRTEIEAARSAAESAAAELASVAHILELPLASGSYEEMMDQLLRGLREELRADEATFLLVDEGQQSLVVQRSDGIQLDRRIRVPLDRGLAGQVAGSGKSLAIEDIRDMEVAHPQLRDEITSFLAAPVRSGGSLIGVLHVGTRERRQFSAPHVRLLELVAERLAGVIARARLFDAERTARRNAEAARRARDEVLSVVSHDLRNPVSTVMMSASILADPAIRLTEEQQRKQLDVIRRSAERMNRLVQDLLDVARIESGRFTINCRCEDAATLAAEAYESFRPMAEEKSQQLECDAEPGLPRVNADRDRILQVLSNYLDNAMKFAPNGGRVTLRVVRSTAGGVRFAVEDNGPGVPENDLPHVFDGFWQAKRTAHLGAGLGLAIARGIAEAHLGRVWAESTPGTGSAFWFELPPSKECV